MSNACVKETIYYFVATPFGSVFAETYIGHIVLGKVVFQFKP
jgi:hypothetical protein